MSAEFDAGVLGQYYTIKPASNSADTVLTYIANRHGMGTSYFLLDEVHTYMSNIQGQSLCNYQSLCIQFKSQ